MSKFSVGMTHPISKKTTDVQVSIGEENKEFLDVVVYASSNAKDYVAAWNRTPLRYGLHTENNVPFLLIDFQKELKSYALPISVFDIKETERSQWLKETSSVSNLFLLNPNSKVIESLRTITLSANIAAEIRKNCAAQLTVHKTAAAVSQAASLIISQKNASKMISAAKMISIMQV